MNGLIVVFDVLKVCLLSPPATHHSIDTILMLFRGIVRSSEVDGGQNVQLRMDTDTASSMELWLLLVESEFSHHMVLLLCIGNIHMTI